MSDDSYVEFVQDQLDALDGVSARAMFGGHGLYRSGDFFGIVHRERLYFRTDDSTRDKYVHAGSGPFMPNPRQTLKSYYEVPADVVDTRERLVEWAREALAVSPPKTRQRSKAGRGR